MDLAYRTDTSRKWIVWDEASSNALDTFENVGRDYAASPCLSQWVGVVWWWIKIWRGNQKPMNNLLGVTPDCLWLKGHAGQLASDSNTEGRIQVLIAVSTRYGERLEHDNFDSLACGPWNSPVDVNLEQFAMSKVGICYLQVGSPYYHTRFGFAQSGSIYICGVQQ